MNNKEHFYQVFSQLAKWATEQGYDVKQNDDENSPVDLYITDDSGFRHEVIMSPMSEGDESEFMAGFMTNKRCTGELLNRFVTEVVEPQMKGRGKLRRLEIDGSSKESLLNSLANAVVSEMIQKKEKEKEKERSKSVASAVYLDASERGLISDTTSFEMADVGDKFFDDDGNLCVAMGLEKGSVQMADRWNAITLEPHHSNAFHGQLRKLEGKSPIKLLATNAKPKSATH